MMPMRLSNANVKTNSGLSTSILNELSNKNKNVYATPSASPMAAGHGKINVTKNSGGAGEQQLGRSMENIRSLSAIGGHVHPYENMDRKASQAMIQGNAGSADMRNVATSNVVARSSSIGILPGLNRPIPQGLPSLAEYGSNPSAMATDSLLIQLKMKKTNRLVEEAGRAPRHKSSINK